MYLLKWILFLFCTFPQNQATEEVSKNLVAMKEILYGTNEKEPQTEAVAQLAQELYNSGLLSTLVSDLQLIDFEVRTSFLNSQTLLWSFSMHSVLWAILRSLLTQAPDLCTHIAPHCMQSSLGVRDTLLFKLYFINCCSLSQGMRNLKAVIEC